MTPNGTFEPTPARALTDEQRGLVTLLFGSSLLPPDTLVAYDGRNLIIEHIDLDRFLQLNPEPIVNLDIRLIADNGVKMHFPIP